MTSVLTQVITHKLGRSEEMAVMSARFHTEGRANIVELKKRSDSTRNNGRVCMVEVVGRVGVVQVRATLVWSLDRILLEVDLV